jgi:hypothetical protein
MTRALVWRTKAGDLFSSGQRYVARGSRAVRGQYEIWQPRDRSSFQVWHKSLNSITGELSGCVIGETNTFESAKALAQTYADRHDGKQQAAGAL